MLSTVVKSLSDNEMALCHFFNCLGDVIKNVIFRHQMLLFMLKFDRLIILVVLYNLNRFCWLYAILFKVC